MNWTLARFFWKHRVRSRTRLILLVLVVGVGVGRVAFVPGIWSEAAGDGFILACLIGFGMISQDVSSGAAQMILVRPVRRADYLMSRYLATCLGAIALGLIELMGAVAMAFTRGADPAGQHVAFAALEVVSRVIPTAAVILLLSSFARGLADLAAYVILFFARPIFDFLGSLGHQAWATWISKAVGWLLNASIPIQQWSMGGADLNKAVMHLVAVTAGCLALAYVLFRRRELTYSD